MKHPLTFFYGSFAGVALALAAAYALGGFGAAAIVAILAILEVTLSFDNAVVNASVLRGWNARYRQLFMWVGLPVAVVGVRLIVPVLIVSVATGLGFSSTFMLALQDPGQYVQIFLSVRHLVAAFGGTFLLMVAFEFFIDVEKRQHWLPVIEPFFARLDTYQKAVGAGMALLALVIASEFVPTELRGGFVIAGVYGFIAYIAVRLLGRMLAGGGAAEGSEVAQGIGGLIYLEILDASFSLDGVIGAFAITAQLPYIMLGLGVGALFVRSLTLLLVERKALETYRYLEHGAFWAILALALIMFAGVFVEIPDVVTGLLGLVLIVLSLMSSYRANAREIG